MRLGQRCDRECKADHVRALAFSLNVMGHFGVLSKDVHCFVVHFKQMIPVLRKRI